MPADKNPIPFPSPRNPAPAEEGNARIVISMGGKRYEIAITATARELPPDAEVAAPGFVIEMQPSTAPEEPEAS
jgi:hypothetical protein